VFSRGLPWEQWARHAGEQKASPLAWPAWREGKPEWHLTDYQSYLNEGFARNSLIYSAIAYKARSSLAAPLRAYVGDPDNPEPVPPGHPLAKLLHRPNPAQSGAEFGQLNTVYLNLAGQCFVHLDRGNSGGVPRAMRSLRPDRVHIIPAAGGVGGYLYVPEGQTVGSGIPLLPQDVLHIKLPNPGDPLEGCGYGFSPLSAIAQSGDVDNQVTTFLKVFFQQGTMVSTVLNFDVPLDEATIARIRERWKEIYGGAANWHEVGVLDQGGKAQRLGMTFAEMGFEQLDDRNESRILAPFGVPGILIGSRSGLARSTYSNFLTARTAFWEDTFVPELRGFEVEYQYAVGGSADGAFPAYDLSRVPGLQKDVPKLVEAANKLWSMGVPANVALQTVGLRVEAIPGGETGYLPVTLAPVGAAAPAAKPPAAAAGEGDMGDGANAEDETRKGLPVPAAAADHHPGPHHRVGKRTVRNLDGTEREMRVIKGGGAEILIPTDLNAKRQQLTADDALGFLNQIPEQHRGLVKEVRLLDTYDKPPYMLTNKATDAAYVRHDGHIEFFRNVPRRRGKSDKEQAEYLGEVMRHEAAHALTTDLGPKFMREWKAAAKKDGFAISDYAKTNTEEDAAETIAKYWSPAARDRRMVELDFPARAKVLAKYAVAPGG